MNIQSLSIAIPGGCPNSCKFCVSKLHKDIKYPNKMFVEPQEYRDRLKYAKELGVNTIILTGEGEPLYNKKALNKFFEENNLLRNPFINIELQTSGIELLNNLNYLKENGVKTISLSLSNMFDDDINYEINQTPKGLRNSIFEIGKKIKEYGFNLRLSLNMNDSYMFDKSLLDKIFFTAKTFYGADQITFRKLYKSDEKNVVNDWIAKHGEKLKIKDAEFWNEDEFDFWAYLNKWIGENGTPLERLPFGAKKYSINGISTVIDDDCMSKENEEAIKYLILRPNCKLYTRWDDKGSLLF